MQNTAGVRNEHTLYLHLLPIAVQRQLNGTFGSSASIPSLGAGTFPANAVEPDVDVAKPARKPPTSAARRSRPAAPADVRDTPSTRLPKVEQIAVGKIRPEEGLGRKRDREGHQELCRSISQFGVLTPITVRRAPDDSGEFLLIKGQGRTLACAMLGLKTIPAVVVDDRFADTQKVQQFLVENVARLRMRPIDRALLIAHARHEGEETSSVAKRFGVSSATVRRLEAQLDGASSGEVAALRSGDVSLALHGVIARYVAQEERADAVNAIVGSGIRSSEMQAVFEALDWRALTDLGPAHRTDRLALLRWAASTLAALPRGEIAARVGHLGMRLPVEFSDVTEASG